MTVRQLITELLDMPMDAQILTSTQMFEEKIEDADYCTKKAVIVVNYEDGTIGIVSSGERLV